MASRISIIVCKEDVSGYTAVWINNCLKIISAIKVAPMKIMDDFQEAITCLLQIDTFRGEQKWLGHKGRPW